MTSDALLAVQSIFSSMWRLFTSWYIPGTKMTPAGWAFFVLSSVLVVRFIMRFGVTIEVSDDD